MRTLSSNSLNNPSAGVPEWEKTQSWIVQYPKTHLKQRYIAAGAGLKTAKTWTSFDQCPPVSGLKKPWKHWDPAAPCLPLFQNITWVKNMSCCNTSTTGATGCFKNISGKEMWIVLSLAMFDSQRVILNKPKCPRGPRSKLCNAHDFFHHSSLRSHRLAGSSITDPSATRNISKHSCQDSRCS